MTPFTDTKLREELQEIHLMYFRYWNQLPKWLNTDLYEKLEKTIKKYSDNSLHQYTASLKAAIEEKKRDIPEPQYMPKTEEESVLIAIDVGYNKCLQDLLNLLDSTR